MRASPYFVRHSTMAGWITATVASLILNSARADVVEHVPKQALGFAVVRNIEQTSEKIASLMGMFDAPLPSPLAFFKARTGFEKGLDPKGDLLLALLPGQQGQEPLPLVLVPVTDFKEFAEALGGDPSGEIAAVQVAGEDVLLGKKGQFAALMNLDSRRVMETWMTVDAGTPDALASIGPWLNANDAVVVVLPAGVKTISGLAKAELDNTRSEFEEGLDELDLDDELRAMRQMFRIYERLLGQVDQEVQAIALGLVVDGEQNVRFGYRVALTPGGRLSEAAGVTGKLKEALAGLPLGPIVGAAGGPWPREWTEAVTQLSIEFMQSYPELYGLENVDESQLEKLADSVRNSLVGLRSMAFSMMAPGEDEPVFSNIYFVFDVDNATTYLDAYKESIRLWNEIVEEAEAGEIVTYEWEAVQVAGGDGIKFAIDFSQMLGEDFPPIQDMMEKIFGEDAKMSGYLVVVDDHRIAGGYLSLEKTEELVKALRAGEAGLPGAQQIRTTAQLLPQDAPWAAYASPKGFVDLARRIVQIVTGAFGGGPEIPEFPETPPIGFSLKLTRQTFEADIVTPAETLKGLSDYVKKMQQ